MLECELVDLDAAFDWVGVAGSNLDGGEDEYEHDGLLTGETRVLRPLLDLIRGKA